MQLQLAPLIGASTRGGGEGARLYTAMAAVTVMFSPYREINGAVLDHRLHAKAAERSLLVPAVAGSTSEGAGGGGGYCIVPYLAASVSVRSTLPDVEQTF